MLFLLSFFFNEKKEEGTAQKATATEFQRQSIPRQLRGLFFCEFLLLFVCLFIGELQWLRSLTSFYLTQSFKQRDNILLPLLLEPHISAWCHFRTKTCNLLHVFCATLLWDIWKTQHSPCVFEEFPGNKVYFEGGGGKNNTGINVVWRWNQILTFFFFLPISKCILFIFLHMPCTPFPFSHHSCCVMDCKIISIIKDIFLCFPYTHLQRNCRARVRVVASAKVIFFFFFLLSRFIPLLKGPSTV